MTIAPETLKRRVTEGILSFPATAFTDDGRLDRRRFGEHIAELVAHGPAAIVPAGGAGEVFSLDVDEHRAVVGIAVAEAGDVPVIAGAGHGVGNACAMARAAERDGAAGILLFPPYLITPEQEGLEAYVAEVCRSVSIGVIAYSRDNGVIEADTALRLADRCPNLVAIKDGTGDFEKLVSLRQRADGRLALINGVPTAEILARQFFATGVLSYTSAVFTFLAPVAIRYYRALRENDAATVERLLDDFYVPLAALRRRRRGYAVAIVKAGLRITGRSAGPVRPPLVELTESELGRLAALIAAVSDILPSQSPQRAGAAARAS